MKTFLTNYHNHTFYCGHAEGNVEDYCILAIKNRMKILGFSEHANIPNTCYTHTIGDFQDNYFLDVLKSKKKYVKTLKIYCGLECDYLPQYNDYYKSLTCKFDYLSLSVHYFRYYETIEEMRKYTAYAIKDHNNMYEYINLLISGIETGFFKFVNHPDNYLFLWDEETKKASMKLINKAIEYSIPLELNISQLRRESKALYNGFLEGNRRYEFWKLVGEMKAKVIINSDCHLFRYFIDKSTEEAIKLAQELNLNVITELEF